MKRVWDGYVTGSYIAPHADEPERAADLTNPLRRRVREAFDSLEDEMRKNLGTELGPPGSTLRGR